MMKKHRRLDIESKSVLSANSIRSPLRQARAQAAYAALSQWKVFTLTTRNLKDLASQVGMTPKQTETALDDLALLEQVQIIIKGRSIFIRPMVKDSEVK
jgi:hypothetical protein